VEVIGTHPLFGPDSGRTGIEGMTIALCPARTGRADSVADFLTSMGLRVEVTTPEEHDRQMAQVQAITHYVARALDRAGLKDHTLKTPSFERLLGVVRTLVKDSPDMFHALETLNPWAAEERARLLDALHIIDKQLASE
jgi:prephenate dehydrogenase